MNVLSKARLLQFAEQYPEAREALLAWFDLCKKADFASFAEVREVFASASWIGPEHIVFNIKGNHFRLITTVDFPYRKIRIKEFMRHQDYNDWKPT